jgi:hypothetical protein
MGSRVSISAVDWDWLTSFPTAEARCEALMNDPGGVRQYEDEITGSEYGSMSFEIDLWDALSQVMKERDKRSADLIHTAFAPILSYDSTDELDFDDNPSAISPATVARMAQALDHLDLIEVVQWLGDGDPQEDLLILRKVMSAMTSGCHWIKSPPQGELSFWERTLLF